MALGKEQAPSAKLIAFLVPVALFAGLNGSVLAQSSSGRPSPPLKPLQIAADRMPLPGTWESAGVEGGIPNRTAICADVAQAPYGADSTGVDSAVRAIQRAIDQCPNGQVVYVPAGTYKIDGRIQIRKSITLRGARQATVFMVSTANPILIQGNMPWPPPRNNPGYFTSVSGGAKRGSTEVTVTNAASIAAGTMVMVDEEDDPALVWTRTCELYRSRASMHMVEARDGNTIRFRPALPIDYERSPRLSVFPDVVKNAGVENINFVGNGQLPTDFIRIASAWNVWVKGSEFSNMPSKTVVVSWSGHVELRRNYLHDQSNGGPNSQGLDLVNDVNWSLVVDNICSAAGFPAINIGDAGAGANFSGGFGNVIAYNYCVDSYYTDPPTSPNHRMMASDIGTNHSPHPQYNLVEGNVMGKFGADGYHGSSSHTVVFRNVITAKNKWIHATNRTAIQVDRRNLYYAIIGNVLGQVGSPTTYEYATTSGWSGSAIFRLGFPDAGNGGYQGTFPPISIPAGSGGPRDLYVDRNTTKLGTLLIEGNWNAYAARQDWTSAPFTLPNSLFLSSKPSWFGDLAWPPVDPANPRTNDPTIIPAGYRFVHGKDPPGAN
jgi:hypothetical protein